MDAWKESAMRIRERAVGNDAGLPTGMQRHASGFQPRGRLTYHGDETRPALGRVFSNEGRGQ
jgi:hypothetical protein